MKTLIVLPFLLTSTLAFATDFTCYDPSVMDSQISATFRDLGTAKPTVELFIPTGETSGVTDGGPCYQDRGTYDYSYTCMVGTYNAHGFVVKINPSFAEDGKFTATIFSVGSEIGNNETILPCFSIVK